MVTPPQPPRRGPEWDLAQHDRARSLDGVRGLAASAIVVLHSGLASGAVLPGSPVATVWRHLNVGVPILFMLSGYLLYTPFARAHAAGDPAPRLAGYAWRRALRIVPAFWLALTVTALVHPREHVFALPHSLLYYFYGQIYHFSTYASALPQAWSLDIEVVFYLLLPLAAWWIGWLMRSRLPWVRAEALGITALLTISLVWKVALATRPGIVTRQLPLLWPPTYLDSFAFGMGLAAFSVWRLRGGRIHTRIRHALAARNVWCGALGVLVLFAVLHPHVDGDTVNQLWTGRRYMFEYLGSYFGLAALLIAPIVLTWGVPRRLTKFLGSRPLAYLGRISYGVYLWQFLALETLRKAGLSLGRSVHDFPSDVVWALAGLALSIAFAAISWRLVEQPFLSFKSRVPFTPEGGHRTTTQKSSTLKR